MVSEYLEEVSRRIETQELHPHESFHIPSLIGYAETTHCGTNPENYNIVRVVLGYCRIKGNHLIEPFTVLLGKEPKLCCYVRIVFQ